ncbi:hypothetical protein DERP_006683 [Dermatophagoides pteronyssinus]|uniref:Uncharacterized protein n=1 Tax=Dermatophagoides pteronyssinus TaxID=6956 RepID=A0ABQ8IQV8_DERPT|nr:hypothetical protein DERP_006683 [Dermatophagoides pteronyssinus]
MHSPNYLRMLFAQKQNIGKDATIANPHHQLAANIFTMCACLGLDRFEPIKYSMENCQMIK